MNSIMEFMRRKVFGVPVGVLALLFAGGLLYMAIRMRPAPEPEPDADLEDTPAGDPDGLDQPVFAATPVIYQPSGIPSVAATPQEDNNELWGRRAIEWLIGNGVSVGDAQTVISRYLAGENLSAGQGEIRDRAVKHFGLPPETIDYGKTRPPQPEPKNHPPARRQGNPPTWHTVKGVNDNNPAELAQLYYGTRSREAVLRIKATAPAMRFGQESRRRKGGKSWEVEVYPVGTRIYIPASYAPKWYRATAANRDKFSIARRNGTTAAKVEELNPGLNFPVKKGTRVRVG